MSKLNSAKAVFASSKTSRRLKRSAWLLSAAVAAITLANPAQAQISSTTLPTGGNVVAGSASIGTPTPSSGLTINQSSDRAVINWTTFDIGSAASVTFVQPSTTSIAVNRVTGGGAPSEIAGQLNANGRVAILNPNGVLFSGTADVNVGSLIASTGDIDTAAFMAGGNLDITGATGGEIVVNGNINITAGSLGLAAFVAPTVRNSGVITATAGRVQLVGGTAFTLDLAGDGLLSVGVPAASALVQNNGQIFAEGGRIQMTAKSASGLVDNLVNTGTLSVDSATLDNGVIVLEAMGGTANLSGTVAANDRNSISRNILISSDQGVNISGNLSGASGTVNITAPHIYGTGKISTATALNLNISNNGTDTRSQGNYINDALGVIGTTGFGTTIKLGAGIYSSGVRIDANDVTIDGQGVAQIGWTSGIENAIDIWGDYVTVRNLEISGPATSSFTTFAWGSTNSRGIFVNRYADNVQLLNNNIHDIRTGIIVDGRNVNTYLLNNTIDNTKSAISVQYTDGSNITMTGNHGSTYGNEWGINLYLNGILQADGTTILPSAGSLGANTPLAEQQRLLALRAANGGMEVQNQGYSALNRTAAYVGTAGSNSNQGSQLGKLATIQAGVNAVVTGGTVYVADGNYNLGSSQLVINHGLNLIGASQAGVVIDGRAVTANGLGTISVLADNVSLSNFSLLGSQLSGGNYGIKVAPNPAGHVNTAGGTSERVSNFSVANVTVSGSRRAELDLNGVVGATITNFTADGQGTDGAGIQITDSSNVTLSGVHTLGNNWGGVALYQSNSASGYNAQTTNINIDAGQNVFEEANGLFTQRDSTTQSFGQLNLTGFNYAIRNTGSRSDASQFVWFQTSLSNATSFALALGAPTTSSIEGYTGTAYSNIFTVVAGMGVDAAVRDARAGATINVGLGTFTFSNTLPIDKSLSLIGASETGTIFDASGLSVYGMRVHADDVSLSGFTLLAPSAASSSTYGIKVEVGAGDVNGNARIDDFSISNVTISGSRKTGLDLNSVVGATLDNVNVTGALAGNGISITDSANITVRNTTTSGNAWGGLALYQANGATGSNQQLTGITIEGNNSFGESNGLYLQDSSATNDVGTLSIAGFDYIVRNTAFRSDGSQFTFFRTSLTDAAGYALSLATPTRSSIEGWAGSAGTNQFTVVNGLSIGAAARDVRAGGTINVGAGTYASGTVLTANGVSLLGSTGAKIDASHDGDNGMTINADGVTVSGFEIFGPANQSYVTYSWPTITRGIVVANGADNVTVTGNNIHDVRNGVLIDGRNANTALTNNVIDNTKSAISVQYTDGSNLTLSGNSEGTFGNEWGIITYLNGIWNGTTITASAGSLGAATPLSEQARLLALSAANGGMAVYNQAYSAANRTRAYVTTAGTASAQGSQRTLLNLQGGLNAVVSGGTVYIGAGTYSEDVSLDALRVLNFAGPVTVNSLTFGTGAAGTNIATNLTAIGALSFAVAPVLTGDTVLTGNTIALGAITSGYGLTLNGANGVSIGLADLASLNVTGSNIVTAGVTTSGAQSYAGNVTLDGDYVSGGDFTVSGLATLASDSTVTAASTASLGSLTGAYNFGVDGANVVLGPVTGLASLTATGATIATSGASTTGIQMYFGATTLNGAYDTDGATFGVSGATTLGGDTSINTAGGNVRFVTLDGAHGLAVNAGTGAVSLGGAVSGLTGLSAIGSSISTAGVATSGNQSYAGATTLGGSYTTGGGSLTVTGASTLTGATSIATSGGAATLGTVAGSGNNLSVATGTGTATLGAATGLGTLGVTGATIVTAGANSSGAQAYTGATSLNGTYSASDLSVTGATTLAGDTNITANDSATLGTVTGAHALTVGANNVTLGGISGLTTLSATGTSIATGGATTSGAQSYTGATNLNGSYTTSGAAFTVNGASTTVNAVSIATAGGNAGLGTVGGTGGLSVNAGTGNVTLGAVNGIASLSATGANIATAGAATSGAQSYTGATTLGGSYSASSLAVTGVTTLNGATSVATTGNASFGEVNGNAAFTVNTGAGAATLGAVTGVTNLSVTGASIATAGAATSGTQSYTGATALNGTYSASAFGVNGGTTLNGATVINGAGVSLGAVTGANSLTINGTGTVSLGAISGVTNLTVAGASIASAGASTSGAQSYTGATSLGGSYTTGGAAFTVNGASTTVNAVSIATAGGNASLGTVGGAGGLSVNVGTGNVTLGAVSGIASLAVTGANIATAGAATSGNQAYTGATSLNGSYATNGGAFTVTGTATTVNAVTVATTGGNATLGTVGGAGGLTVSAGTGSVTLGAVNGIASLSASGASIATAGAATTGAQSYTGATTLGGSYSASSLAVNGTSTLNGATSVTTSGNASFGAVNGNAGFTVNAGAGTATLGAVTGVTNLSVTGASITSNGAATSGSQVYTGATSLSGTYTGSAFTVAGATNLAGTTSVTTANGAISLATVDAAIAGTQGLTLNAGTGSVALGNLGATRRLGATSVNAGSTVLNGATYAANSLSFTGGTGSSVRLTQATTTLNTTLPGGVGGAIAIQPDLIGTVNAAQNIVFAAGNGVTVNSGDVTIGNAGSDAIRLGTMTVNGHNFTGATVKLAGNYTSVLSGSQVFSANTLDTLANVNAQVAGFESGPIRAGGSVTIDAGGSGSGSIIAGGAVNVQYDGNVDRTITSQSNVTIASLGSIGGSVTTTGAVGLQTTSGAITSIVNAGGTASLSSQTGAVNATVTGAGGVSVETNGAITGSYTSPTSITITSPRPVDVQVNGTMVTVTAPSGTVTGVFTEIHTTNTGTLVVNDQPVIGSGTTDARQIIIDTFIIPTRGTVSANGEIQLPAGLALGLIAPAGNGQGGQRPAVVVNNVQRLGELLREGYTAIIIQLDETNLDVEEEVAGQ